MKKRLTRGFTLLELMVAVAIFAILLVVGVPTFRETVNQNRAISDANALLSVLVTARSEATKRDRSVILCTSSDGMTCSTAVSWDRGYVMFVDTNGDGVPAASEIIKGETPLSTGSTISSSAPALAHSFAFASLGKAITSTGAVASGTFVVAPKNQSRFSRGVVVSFVGRIRICDPSMDTTCNASATS